MECMNSRDATHFFNIFVLYLPSDRFMWQNEKIRESLSQHNLKFTC